MKKLLILLGFILTGPTAFGQGVMVGPGGVGVNAPGIGVNAPGVGVYNQRYRLNPYPYANPYPYGAYPVQPPAANSNTAVVGQPTYFYPYSGYPYGPAGNYPAGLEQNSDSTWVAQ